MIFKPCADEIFFKSKNSADPRLGNLVGRVPNGVETSNPVYSVAGYPDDEGISINGGRPGASAGPDCIRKYFYKMTPSAWSSQPPLITDEGNLDISPTLGSRHEILKNHIAEVLKNENHTWIGLGGGHDYGYPDGAGFLLSQKNSKLRPLVINFDAHLDVRPDDRGLSSGTPFFRLLTDKNLPQFDFVEVGLQSQCNSREHLNWLTERGGHILGFDELNARGNFVETALERLAPLLLKPRPTYLSVDIDAFSSAYAPGCSQSWATGLIPNEFMALFKILKTRLRVRVLGIYEVSPPLDIDDRTSKLAAQIIHALIY